ncbi:glycosyltransferase [Synechococcales cyanobacterium C]|uniref:Glycosyltransferase n=1 Tax=Petrachloros mirabilis ULC683 TaxID=2781853 RepID=A0A8K2A9N7_9CYAN|nr:glycosyltransferase family 2 protein [Petrachloros mirabilis]NCJ08454.1 glycosyltransferase [Petrachloros mirabilis ULC683]
MNSRPLVSCIIIFLNEEQFLEAAIQSILAQTYTDWELLLVDDGSTDLSASLARQYAQDHPNQIYYLEHPQHQNLGMSASRNLGLTHAQGDYIAFLDGDDVWTPEKLTRQIALLRAHPEASFIFGPLLAWYSWSTKTPIDHLYGVGPTGMHPYADQVVQPPQLLTLQLQNEEFIPSGALIAKDVIQQVGGFETTFRTSYEDAVLWVKLCLVATAFVSSECWYHYRIHPQSVSRTEDQQGLMLEKQKIFLKWVSDYLKSTDVRDFQVWQALHQAQRQCNQARAKKAAKQIGFEILPKFVYNFLKQNWHKFHSKLQ